MYRWKSIIALGVVLFVAGASSAVPVLDQSFDASGGSSGLAIWTDGYQGMTFTVGASGWLNQVGMQIHKSQGTTGDIEFELRNTSAGVPLSTPGGVVCTGTIPIADVPVSDTYTGSVPYTMVDTSPADVPVQLGDIYALCLHREGQGSPPWALWRAAGDLYAGGQRFWRASSSDPWTSLQTHDFGFQTWVDTAISQNVTIAPTFDVEAESSDGSHFTIVEGNIFIEQYRSPTTDDRGLIEFDISDIPDSATIISAKLTLDISGYASSGGKYSEIDLCGYAGNGTPEPADALNVSYIIGTTGPLQTGGIIEVALDEDYIESLLGTADYLGLVANARWDYFQSTFCTSEYHASIPSVIEPTLTVEYVPEPTTFSLLVLSGLTLLRRRPRIG